MEEYFKDSLKELNILLNEEQIIQFFKFMDLLILWNEKINITRIIEPKEIITKHFIDSLSILQFFDDYDKKIIDIGTGGGFPGIPLKIVKPELEITLVDSLNKRIVFLDEVIKELGLKGITSIHGRGEQLGNDKKYREQFDIATSRAVANLRVLSEFSIPFVKKGGKFISIKGPKVINELKESKKIIKKLGGKPRALERLTLPNSHGNHFIVIVDKVSPTPAIFPRNMTKINNEPI